MINAELEKKIVAKLLTGEACRKIAKDLGCPESTVFRVSTKLNKLAKYTPPPVPTEEEKTIVVMLEDLILESLQAMKAIRDNVKDPKWIVLQTGTDLANLYGVLSDKTFRVLDAFSKREREAQGQMAAAEDADIVDVEE